jgi:hypothetical protein
MYPAMVLPALFVVSVGLLHERYAAPERRCMMVCGRT